MTASFLASSARRGVLCWFHPRDQQLQQCQIFDRGFEIRARRFLPAFPITGRGRLDTTAGLPGARCLTPDRPDHLRGEPGQENGPPLRLATWATGGFSPHRTVPEWLQERPAKRLLALSGDFDAAMHFALSARKCCSRKGDRGDATVFRPSFSDVGPHSPDQVARYANWIDGTASNVRQQRRQFWKASFRGAQRTRNLEMPGSLLRIAPE